MFEASDLRARIRRLDELTRGLMKEVVHVEDAEDPVLCLRVLAHKDSMCFTPDRRGA